MWNKIKDVKVDRNKAAKVCFGVSVVGFALAGLCVMAEKRGVFNGK